MMFTSTVKLSSKGQIVIPKEVRESFHWESDAELLLVVTEQGVILQNKNTSAKKQPAEALRGFLQDKYQGKPISTEQLCQAVAYQHDSV